MNIPPGFTKCPVCGEYNGTTKAKYLNWEGYQGGTIDPEKDISVTCLCNGPMCPRCNKNHVHKPGSNSYEEETNTIGHWPVLPGLWPCDECA